ncbi:hypothetical protein SD70_07005 [Gordoniibacillus kamchatkensis]|uniref:Uncharacterized protein n=1 Tax=Gordoniibacillus kamchatkensis TaxID=1590651 RepID=A0ABR5ALJ4_9BACL|nr:YlzJ-like family protein [Paenibacillus sp. VKM B-2647]KIL41395.1 hypothetical protein SD70_07005 [Paenibacillus sp. VKM B-2647]
MILYTPMPLERVFEGIEELEANTFTATVGGVEMELQPAGERQARIVRLLSPNPQHYLRPEHAPGSLVQFSPQLGDTKPLF